MNFILFQYLYFPIFFLFCFLLLIRWILKFLNILWEAEFRGLLGKRRRTWCYNPFFLWNIWELKQETFLEPRTATGCGRFSSYFTCLHTTAFILLRIFSLVETISLKIWERPLRNAKCSLPISIRYSKTSTPIYVVMEHAILAPVVQTLDSAILWINHYPLDNSIGFASVYPLDSNLSGGQRYPSFEQLGPVW